MTRIRNNNHAGFALPVAVIVGVLALIAAVTTPKAVATTSGAPSKISPEADAALASSGQARLKILLTSNTFLARIPSSTTKLLKTTRGSTAARRDARSNPTHRSNSESVAASIAENARNAALPAVRRAASIDVEQSDRIRRYIEWRGGKVISASPIPNQVTAIVTRDLARLLASKSAVRAIQLAQAPIQMNAPIDGSSTWWAGGFTGQGTSADGNGSPDAVVFDTGVRATHLAFKSRLPGDLPDADGSGPSRIYSKVGRTDLIGSKHANTVAATIGSTAFLNASGGMAYGIDKLYDDYETFNPYLWNIGVTAGGDPGLGGEPDLPEVINYSAGIYENEVDYNEAWIYFDALEERMGILNTVSAGNCGTQDSVYNGCSPGGPYRVSTPGNSYNVLTMGGLDTTTPYPDTSGYIPWLYTSPGPTWGGRKKPDLIAPVFGVAGTPAQVNDTTWTSGGYGTSFAAPIGAAGALLLASSGVYLPTAQKAIMINSATPVQGQDSWMPKAGWGALNMTTAYSQRGNYVNDSIGSNDVRFFHVTGIADDDRSTLVWNRRTSGADITVPAFYGLTDLDLTQMAPGTETVTSTGGSDANDTADSDTTPSTDNPIPGNGSDGGDNVEQIHSTDMGTQILKVKSLSAVDGATTEPFSVASTNPVTALETPTLQVSLQVTPPSIGAALQARVTATVENTSDDIDLENVSVELSLPAGLNLPIDDPVSPEVSLPAGGTTTAIWNVEGGYSGTKTLSATATGSAYGETFSGSDTTSIDVDMDPPTLSVPAQPLWSTTSSPTFQWSGIDSLSAVDSYDVEFAIDNGAFIHLLTAQDPGSATIVAQEGQKVRVRIRATDLFGNVSDWTEVSTTIDAIPPVASFGTVDASRQGIRSVPLFFSNVGSPVTATFTFANKNGGRTGTALNGGVASYTNNESKPEFAQLTLVATDALGRRATAQDTYLIEPRLGSSGLKFKSAKRSGSSFVIKGSIAKTFSGKVSVVATRIGSKGTKRDAKKAAVKKGAFTVKLRLEPGRYKFAATSPKTSKFSATTISSKLTIK